MYVLYHTEGQTCNHYFQYLYYLEKSVQEGSKLRVLFPDVTIGDYPKLLRNMYISYPLYFSWMSHLLGNRNQIRIIHRIYKKIFTESIRNFISRISNHKIIFVSGVEHWNENYNYKDLAPILSPLFLPDVRVTNKVDSHFSKMNYKKTIGIHIRGGDYRLWRGGQYFFTPDVYYEFMKKMLLLLNEKADDVLFYISSNENIDLNVFSGLKCMMLKEATAVEDLYALSKCDYIIGTVSTFSGWVSFLNSIPRYYFLKKDDYQTMCLDDFIIPYNNIVNF